MVGQLTYCQGLYVEVLATSGSAAYLLGGSTIHRYFRLDIEMKSRLELGTVDCIAVANTDVIIVDECSMMSAVMQRQTLPRDRLTYQSPLWNKFVMVEQKYGEVLNILIFA